MKWRWWRRDPNGAAAAAAEQVAKLHRAQRATPHVERMAQVLADDEMRQRIVALIRSASRENAAAEWRPWADFVHSPPSAPPLPTAATPSTSSTQKAVQITVEPLPVVATTT